MPADVGVSAVEKTFPEFSDGETEGLGSGFLRSFRRGARPHIRRFSPDNMTDTPTNFNFTTDLFSPTTLSLPQFP